LVKTRLIIYYLVILFVPMTTKVFRAHKTRLRVDSRSRWKMNLEKAPTTKESNTDLVCCRAAPIRVSGIDVTTNIKKLFQEFLRPRMSFLY
jgi:hypothetical protein